MIWNFDPVAFFLFGFPIRWYGLVYVGGFFLCSLWGWNIYKSFGKTQLTSSDFESLLFGVFLWGVLGGRVGELLLYRPEIFLTAPQEVFFIWKGGMSFHGGLFSALFFLWIRLKKDWSSFFRVTDSLAIPLACVLVFGRFANFVNGELVGKPTEASWGVIFPHIDDQLRHPTQIYESLKNLILMSVLLFVWKQKNNTQGILTAVFLGGYGVLRFIIEFWKPVGWVFLSLNAGQWFSLIVMGLSFWGYRIIKKQQ